MPHIRFAKGINLALIISETCEASLFKRYAENKCKFSLFLLYKETFISIRGGYIVIPIKETKLDINCEHFIKQEVISKPSLMRGSNCKIYNDYDTLYLKETFQISTIEQFTVIYNIKYSREDLDNLKNQLVQLPKLIDNVTSQRARLSLDDTKNMLQNIAQNRRVKTWTEKLLEYLNYLGYTALALGTLYLAYRTGLLDFIKNCIPKKFCLFRVKTKVIAPAHIVTYNPSIHLITEPPKNRRVKV